jgi:membrane-associated PAP2 superfamily phosphatase
MYNNINPRQKGHGSGLFTMAVAPFFLILTAVFFEYSGFDSWWVSHFYDARTHSWPFKDHWLFQTVIHQGGKDLDIAAGLLWLALFALSWFAPTLKNQRRLLVYFLVATGTGPLLVGAGKHLAHIYTPWDLAIFSGTLPHIRLFDPVPTGLPVGHAFPAGHASGGYAFLSLYFAMDRLGSCRKIYGLVTGLGLGLVFGLGQQIRGAHFPSHDLFTLVICWYAALVFYFIFFPETWPRTAGKFAQAAKKNIQGVPK